MIKKSSKVRSFFYFSVVIAVSAGVFFGWQKISSEKIIEKFEASIKNIENSINNSKKTAVQNTVTVEDIEIAKKNRVLWSNIFSQVIKKEGFGVRFVSFQVEEDKKISAELEATSFSIAQNFLKKLQEDTGISELFFSEISNTENNTSAFPVKISLQFLLSSE